MDWHTRAVLSWKLSNTLDMAFCPEALKEAVATAGCVPEIFNTDQGCQFTSNDWTRAVEGLGIKVSMDGRGRWMDNVFIERLWRSLKSATGDRFSPRHLPHGFAAGHPASLELSDRGSGVSGILITKARRPHGIGAPGG